MESGKDNEKKLSHFETLEKKNNLKYDEKWSPYTVDRYEGLLSHGSLTDMSKELRKNIVYTLQYLEYLQLQLDELNLHSIIKTMIYKNYIISGVSIIEGIFYHLLKSTNNWRQTEWTLMNTVKSNSYTQQSETYKIETQIYHKVENKDDEMNLDSMIKKMEAKKILELDHADFPFIKKLKSLRNKVHLQINEHPNDTDWYSFNLSDYLWMRYILYAVLSNSTFKNTDLNVLSFIKLDEAEIQDLKKGS